MVIKSIELYLKIYSLMQKIVGGEAPLLPSVPKSRCQIECIRTYSNHCLARGDLTQYVVGLTTPTDQSYSHWNNYEIETAVTH